MRSLGFAIGCWLAVAFAVPAAELRLLPPDVTLHGRHASQRVIAVECDGPVAIADRSGSVTLTSAHPHIVTVDREGILRPRADGTTTITARFGDKTASITVKVVELARPSVVDFHRDVMPVLTRAGCNSGACHGALAGKGGLKLSLRGYAAGEDWHALTRQALGRRVDLVRPDESLLLQKPTRSLPHAGGKRFESDSEEARRLRDWIAGGATPGEPKRADLAGLAVYPRQMRLTIDATMPVVAVATYADGTTEDVTPWARFTSAGDAVAGIDEAGLVKVAGPGETALCVGFGTQVSPAVVTVPYPRDPIDLAKEPRHNFIDEHVLWKLESLRIPPSPPADDRTLIRRAYLDTLGILPTPHEVEKFVADAAPDKRDRLARALVARPEYVDYWTYRWCDVLLLSSRKLPAAELWSFYRFVRAAVAENRGWDRFARDIVAYRGSTLTAGAGNYFVLHKDPAELTEATAVTFLGMSIACAKCHNHPMEKWTQDQYWALANVFGRVGRKAGDRAGEVIITEEPTGDVPHQRRGVPQPPAPLDGPVIGETADRRAAFADWLTRPDNPYFARATVNRVWKSYFGRGLVDAEDDFRESNPPTHPELLDELATQFVRRGHDLRWLTVTILTSATYQRSAVPVPGNAADDRWLSRSQVRRLPAEVILDAYSQVTGVPTNFPEVFSLNLEVRKTDQYPPGARAVQLPDVLIVSRFLDTFGRPAREQACSCERQHEPNMTQALHLANGATLNDKLRSSESLVARWIQEQRSDREAVAEAFRVALGRTPTPNEEQRLTARLAEYGTDRRAAFEDLFWAVLTSREFLFNH